MKKYIKIDKSKNEDLLKKAIIESTIKEMEKEYPNFIEIKGEKYILSRKGISRMVYLLDN